MTSRDKYNDLKPILDHSCAKITQTGEEEFYQHKYFLSQLLKSISLNEYKPLYEKIGQS